MLPVQKPHAAFRIILIVKPNQRAFIDSRNVGNIGLQKAGQELLCFISLMHNEATLESL